MRKFEVHARGSTVDAGGRAEPYNAWENIQYGIFTGQITTEQQVEEVADRYHCQIIWHDE